MLGRASVVVSGELVVVIEEVVVVRSVSGVVVVNATSDDTASEVAGRVGVTVGVVAIRASQCHSRKHCDTTTYKIWSA